MSGLLVEERTVWFLASWLFLQKTRRWFLAFRDVHVAEPAGGLGAASFLPQPADGLAALCFLAVSEGTVVFGARGVVKEVTVVQHYHGDRC